MRFEKIVSMRIFPLIQKNLFLAVFLLIVSLSLRVFWLDKFPVGIVHDNMIFSLNARAVYFTGTDVSGLWHPLSFAPIPDEPAQAELTYSLLSITNGVFP